MPILILGYTPKEEVGELIKNNITQAVTCKAKALEYSEEAVKCNGTLKIHIKVDTGMSRLGYLCDGDYFDSGVEGICEGCELPGLMPEGIFTHFAVSDEPGEECSSFLTEGSFCEYIMVMQGVLTLETEDGTYEVSANHAIRLDAESEHSYHNKGTERLVLNIFIAYDAVSTI